jgi:NitT/TauT family transport system substrate-binding protein
MVSIYVALAIMLPILAACDSGQAPTPTAATAPPTPTAAPPEPTATAAPTEPTATAASVEATVTTAAGSGDRTVVRLGYVPVMIFAPLFVAQERGYFAEQGLDVQLTPVQGGSDSVVQLAAGNFDAAVGGAGAGLFNAAQRGVKFTIVAPMHQERPPLTTPLVISAKRAGEFKSVADLKGKKVSTNAAGSATEYWLAQALAKDGLTMNDIQLTTLAFRDVPAALDSGALDAAMLGEPLVTINEDNGLIKVLAEDFINGFSSTYVYMGDPLLKGNPKAARGFMLAYLRACRDLQGNYMNPDIAAIIEKYTKVPAAVSLKASTPQFDPNGTIKIQDLQTLQEHFMSRGALEYKTLLDVTTLVDTTLAADVARELDNK